MLAPVFAIRKWYIVACSLAVAADVAIVVSQHSSARVVMSAARRAQEIHDHGRVVTPTLFQTDQFIRSSAVMAVAAMAFLLLAILAWTASLRAGEPGLQSIPLLLIAVGVIMSFIIV